MTCNEFKELAAAFAIGALDDDEANACEGHLQAEAHDGCENALRQAQHATAALGASLDPVPVPRAVWQRIEEEISAATVVADSSPAVAPPRRTSRWGQVVSIGLLAAAAVALLFMNG